MKKKKKKRRTKRSQLKGTSSYSVRIDGGRKFCSRYRSCLFTARAPIERALHERVVADWLGSYACLQLGGATCLCPRARSSVVCPLAHTNISFVKELLWASGNITSVTHTKKRIFRSNTGKFARLAKAKVVTSPAPTSAFAKVKLFGPIVCTSISCCCKPAAQSPSAATAVTRNATLNTTNVRALFLQPKSQ
eukprot:SAG31_NODE_96_length_25743_cov_56.175948_7_plen_192_part_00